MSYWANLWAAFTGETKQLGDGFGGSMLESISRSGRPPRRKVVGLLAAYSQMPRLRSIVDRISDSTAAVNWRAFRTPASRMSRDLVAQIRCEIRDATAQTQRSDENHRVKTISRLISSSLLTEVESHPVLALFRKPNPTMTGFQYRKLKQIYLDLTGEQFAVKQRNGVDAIAGPVSSLWPQAPNWVRRMPERGRPTFEIQQPGGNVEQVPPENVFWMRHLDPLNPYGRGTGLAGSLSDELDGDEYAAKMTAAKMFNNGIPEWLIIAEGMRTEAKEAFQEDWKKQTRPGHLRRGAPHFTNAKNLKAIKLEHSIVENGVIELRNFYKSLFVETFGVPPEILGMIENSNRATINSAQFLYACNVLLPRLMMQEDAINEDLVRDFGDGNLILLFDNPVPEDRQFALEVSKAHPYAFNLDFMRELAGESPLEGDAGNQHPLPFNLTLTDLEGGDTTIAPAEEEAEDEERTFMLLDDLKLPSWEQMRDATAHTLEDYERELFRPLLIEEKIDDPLARQVDAAIREIDIMEQIRPVWIDQMQSWLKTFQERTGIEVSDMSTDVIVMDHLEDLATMRLSMVSETVRDQVRAAVAEAVRESEGQTRALTDLGKKIRDKVQGVFRKAINRAKTIARTEVNRSGNFVVQSVMRVAGIAMREWVTTLDGEERDTHNILDGQAVAINQPFVSASGATAMHPGGFGLPEEDINCRCIIIPVLPQREVGLDRVAAWKAFDRAARRWEDLATQAFRRAFDAQLAAALEVITVAHSRQIEGPSNGVAAQHH